jgi:hypothetical protein
MPDEVLGRQRALMKQVPVGRGGRRHLPVLRRGRAVLPRAFPGHPHATVLHDRGPGQGGRVASRRPAQGLRATPAYPATWSPMSGAAEPGRRRWTSTQAGFQQKNLVTLIRAVPHRSDSRAGGRALTVVFLMSKPQRDGGPGRPGDRSRPTAARCGLGCAAGPPACLAVARRPGRVGTWRTARVRSRLPGRKRRRRPGRVRGGGAGLWCSRGAGVRDG